MTEDFLDAEFPAEDSEIMIPPLIQWINGSHDPNHPPVLNTGGFELPVDRFEFLLGDEVEIFNVPHQGGVVVPAYLYSQLSFALVAIAENQWFTHDSNNHRVWLPRNFKIQEGQKVSSRRRLWCLCKELGNEPALLTFIGMASKSIGEALDTFRQQVVIKASRYAARKSQQAQKPYPLYAFWFSLRAGPYETYPKGGAATPPILATEDFSIDSLRSLYVGQGVLDLVQHERSLALAWKKEQDLLAERGSEVMRIASEPPPNFLENEDDLEPALTEEEIPF